MFALSDKTCPNDDNAEVTRAHNANVNFSCIHMKHFTQSQRV